jgi:hypothetical protein
MDYTQYIYFFLFYTQNNCLANGDKVVFLKGSKGYLYIDRG